MPEIVLPATLRELFPDSPKRVELAASGAATVDAVLDRLDDRWPGMRDRLCASSETGPVIRRHLIIYVGRERADLATAVPDDAEVRIIPALSGG
jgi:molybdopterin converting factor small subunit